MADDQHLWTIIGLDGAHIPELRRLDNLLNDLHRDPSNEDKLLNNSDALIRILETLCRDAYPIFREIDLSRREMLLSRVSTLWQPFRIELKRILPRSTWEILQVHAQTFAKLCTFDFQRRTLLFAREAFTYKNLPNKLESKLIGLIENIRRQHPKILDDILSDEYKILKDHQRRNIVITVLGSAKASKSSLINFLLDNEICPTDNRAATARLTRITFGKAIRLTLRGSQTQSEIFDNTKQLLAKAREMIILKNEHRKSVLCNDEVFIELPIEELIGLELWDVPGFDENHVINNRIKEILQNTDLILAVLAQQESLRQTSIDFIKPCLEQSATNKPQTKICFIISQIDRFKPDGQSGESREVFLQHIYDKICTELPMNFPRIDYKNSDQFIPMCSSPQHNIKDYLECRELFITKSCQWFTQALTQLTRDRTDLILKSVREFSNYENIFLQQTRFQRMRQIFNEQFIQFSVKLPEKIKKKLTEIQKLMKQSIHTIAIQCRDLFYQSKSLEDIEDYIQTQLRFQFSQILSQENPEIVQMIQKMFLEFSDTIELKPVEIQKLKQVLNETLDKDYYSGIIRQHEHTSPYHLSAYFSRIFQALSETLKATIKIPTGDFKQIRKACDRFTKREDYLHNKTIESITELVNEILEVMSDKIQLETEKTLKGILNHQLEQIQKRIERQLQVYLHSSMNDTKINHIRSYCEAHAQEIKRIHLDTLDLQCQLDFKDRYQINLEERLDQNNHFEIFQGTLGENAHPIAVKLIPVEDFHLQEVLYIREIKHKNLIKYYGVKKGDMSHYYIIMPQFDCNLNQYIKEYLISLDSRAIHDMIIQIIKGLNYIHMQLELIHWNIRTDNILVQQEKKRFVIGQLGGIHRNIDYYSAPEIFPSDRSSMITDKYDIYSLGVTIREILRLSHLLRSEDKLIGIWLKIAEKCCLQEATARPSCRKLLESIPSI